MSRELKVRVFFEHANVHRKFFTVFAGKDNSFYVHLSRPAGQPWRYPGLSAPNSDGMARLDFKNFVEPAFDLSKVSLHPSGFIHSTDPYGKRYTDGLRGRPFSEMTLPTEICAMYPCHPSALPLFDQYGGNTIRILIPEETGPFGGVLSIIETAAPETVSGSTNLLFAGFRFSLRLTPRPVTEMIANNPPPWPPFPFFFLNTTR